MLQKMEKKGEEQSEEVSPQMPEGRPADPEKKAVSWAYVSLGSTNASQTHREFPATAKSQRPEGAATKEKRDVEPPGASLMDRVGSASHFHVLQLHELTVLMLDAPSSVSEAERRGRQTPNNTECHVALLRTQ
ncbi:hypothetical protein P7K49_000216 [Saguinus oedipus]|uniref:Uncharacterized protein n=1 Tax=Saguinus oedipus TaxID=9490 RepID=A0ABQ9WBL2_SAGOE|nr:hypothetical protein P7K49_000216 [Saguinus oedipus]